MLNIIDARCNREIKIHILCSVFFFTKIAPFMRSCGKQIYVLDSDRPQMTIWRMRIACWIPKPTNTHSEYIIPIALPLQQWLYERA